jgi:hypothetical protein
MAMRIWKWSLKMATHQDLELPRGAKFLDLQLQGVEPQVWFLCDTDNALESRRLMIHGTDQPMPDFPGQYLATFQTGAFVWHLFEVSPPTTEQRIDL